MKYTEQTKVPISISAAGVGAGSGDFMGSLDFAAGIMPKGNSNANRIIFFAGLPGSKK